MSWLFSQALVAEYSADTCSDGAPSAPSSTTPTPQAYLWRGKMMDAWRRFPSGMTSAPLTDDHGEAVLTWCLEVFHAKTSASQENVQESLETEADYGDKWRELLARYDHDSCSWKTAQPSFLTDSDTFSATWPRWGTMRDGGASALSMSALLMGATEFGLLRQSSLGNRHAEQTTDGSVIGAVQRFPAADAITGNGSALTAESGHTHFIMKNGTVARSAVPPMWPTPQANEDAAGTPAGKMQRMLGNHPLIRGSTPEEWRSGTLNPTWVEWLMGWPLGWTDCAASATDKCQQWRRSHGVCSGVDDEAA